METLAYERGYFTIDEMRARLSGVVDLPGGRFKATCPGCGEPEGLTIAPGPRPTAPIIFDRNDCHMGRIFRALRAGVR